MPGVLAARVNPGRAQAEPGGGRDPSLCAVLLSEFVVVPPLALSTRCGHASRSPCGFRPSARAPSPSRWAVPFTQPRSGLGGTAGPVSM